MNFHIKNMVCIRCERAVRRIFTRYGLPVTHLTLGLVSTSNVPDAVVLSKLEADLEEEGFVLIRSPEKQLINRIKSFVITYLDRREQRTFSEALSAELHGDYGHLSRQFRRAEGRTLESYVIAQRIERAKELLQMGELPISTITDQLGYRTNSHFSAQFKQATGMSPSTWRKSADDRQSLDKL